MINEYVVKKYCNEDISLIENFEKAIYDSTQTWDCHHRRENISSRKKLIELGEYYHRPASELIFLTQKEHRALHKKYNKYRLGAHHTEETKQKLSIANKGKTPWIKGKHLSEESKQKLSESRKGLHWFNNGIIAVMTKSCPEGFVKGRLKK